MYWNVPSTIKATAPQYSPHLAFLVWLMSVIFMIMLIRSSGKIAEKSSSSSPPSAPHKKSTIISLIPFFGSSAKKYTFLTSNRVCHSQLSYACLWVRWCFKKFSPIWLSIFFPPSMKAAFSSTGSSTMRGLRARSLAAWISSSLSFSSGRSWRLCLVQNNVLIVWHRAEKHGWIWSYFQINRYQFHSTYSALITRLSQQTDNNIDDDTQPEAKERIVHVVKSSNNPWSSVFLVALFWWIHKVQDELQ